jgi:hypothetical protein
MRRPPLYVGDILRWADEFYRRRGRWPHRDDGPIEGALDLTWRRIDSALKLGNRGLRPRSSLAKLLLTHRRRRHKGFPPSLTEAQILAWADVRFDNGLDVGFVTLLAGQLERLRDGCLDGARRIWALDGPRPDPKR